MNHGKFRKFGGAKSETRKVEEEECAEEEGGGSLMSKLEKFSGMWTDLDTAPVIVDTKREANKYQEEENRFPAVESSFPNKWKRTEDANQKAIDNQKRVQSLQQRSETLKAQHSLINSALTLDRDSKKNNRIVFEEEDDEPQKDSNSQVSKKKILFGKEIDIRIHPNQDGASGQEMLKQKSKGFNDKVNQHFSEKTNKIPDDEEPFDSGEKDHQLAILSSLLQSNDTQTEETKNQPKTKAKTLNAKDQTKKGIEDPQALPEVSQERYYQTTKALDIGKGSEFSLRTLFQQSGPDEEVEEEEEKQINFHKEPIAYTETKKIIQPVHRQTGVEQQHGYWKNAGMWHEPLFFVSGDARFKEAVDFIQQTAKDEAYRDRNKWFEQREKLKQFYRNKMRRHALWVAESTQHPQKKRALVDVADESSYHFYGQQDEIERQKKKKPHRTFFK